MQNLQVATNNQINYSPHFFPLPRITKNVQRILQQYRVTMHRLDSRCAQVTLYTLLEKLFFWSEYEIVLHIGLKGSARGCFVHLAHSTCPCVLQRCNPRIHTCGNLFGSYTCVFQRLLNHTCKLVGLVATLCIHSSHPEITTTIIM